MLGSRKTCPNCHDTNLRRVPVNRTIQCSGCKLILEERAVGDLSEVHVVTQTEESHFVVAPDSLLTNIVDDNPRDPYCTPGFISVFRMLSPLREPLFTTSSRTYSGALAEMERLIGDALFAGYIGYNGRAPGGVPLKKEETVDGPERNKSGGDARHTLVAYFEIVELASILGVDKETINLAVRIFRHTASNTSLRNRNVECMATAAFVAAAERRWFEYEAWMKKNGEKVVKEPPPIPVTGSEIEHSSAANGSEEEKQRNGKMDFDAIQERTSDIMMLDESITAEKVSMALALDRDETFGKEEFQRTRKAGAAVEVTREERGAIKEEPVESEPVKDIPDKSHDDDEATDLWPIPPRHLSLEEISSAANLDVNEVTRYLKVVRVALRKQRPESSASVTGHMPLFCRRLDLPAKTEKLAIGIAENALRNNICSRRNPVSISAAAIYLACQMEGVRKTQTEICRATNLTEVTLRKVYKELNREHSAVVPAWYKAEQSTGDRRSLSERSNGQHFQEETTVTNTENGAPSASRIPAQKDVYALPNVGDHREQNLPVPPPLPPGFGEQTSKSSCGNEPEPPPPPALPPQQEQTIPPAPTSSSSNPLMTMMSNPAMQAFANAFSMMPQLMMPPPPPPLPPPVSEQTNSLQNNRTEKSSSEDEGKQTSSMIKKGQSSSGAADKMKDSPKSADTSNQGRPSMPVSQGVNSQLPPGKTLLNSSAHNSASTLSQDPQNVMAGMQSMLGMMQAMQAFQMMQQGQSGQGGREGGASSMSPWAAMTSLMRLQNHEVANVQKPTTDEAEAVNHNKVRDSVAKELKASISREPQKSALSSKAPPGSKPDES